MYSVTGTDSAASTMSSSLPPSHNSRHSTELDVPTIAFGASDRQSDMSGDDSFPEDELRAFVDHATGEGGPFIEANRGEGRMVLTMRDPPSYEGDNAEEMAIHDVVGQRVYHLKKRKSSSSRPTGGGGETGLSTKAQWIIVGCCLGAAVVGGTVVGCGLHKKCFKVLKVGAKRIRGPSDIEMQADTIRTQQTEETGDTDSTDE